jgi:5-methylcytosine-specific restriction endonuclease McrA
MGKAVCSDGGRVEQKDKDGQSPSRKSAGKVAGDYGAGVACGEKHIANMPVQAEAEPVASRNGGKSEKSPAPASTGKVTIKSLLKLLETQGGLCALTGRVLTPENVAVDHIEPYSAGVGQHCLENIQLIVREANSAKGTMSNVAFIEMCHDVSRCRSNWKLN